MSQAFSLEHKCSKHSILQSRASRMDCPLGLLPVYDWLPPQDGQDIAQRVVRTLGHSMVGCPAKDLA